SSGLVSDQWVIEGSADQYGRRRRHIHRLVYIPGEAGEVGKFIGIARIHAKYRAGQGHPVRDASSLEQAAHAQFARLDRVFPYVAEPVGGGAAIGVYDRRAGEGTGLVAVAHTRGRPSGDIFVEVIL